MIYFVGAGPGAADLITVRGQKLLSEAGLVVYAGSLVNPDLLSICKPTCKIKNSAEMTLDEVIEVMEEANGMNGINSTAVIVRLHTGDPSIYGAIREQIDELRKRDIPFEIVPGVSSFCAAAAALEVEYTLPGVSQTVIISRMAGRTSVPEGESIRLLASHGATMVLFLSVGMLDKLCKELIAGGYAEYTPAAIVYKASWPEQMILHGTISTIADKAKENGVKKTALVLVGNFLGSEYELSKLYDPSFSHEYRSGKP